MGLMAATPVADTAVWTAGVALTIRVGPDRRRSDACRETTEGDSLPSLREATPHRNSPTPRPESSRAHPGRPPTLRTACRTLESRRVPAGGQQGQGCSNVVRRAEGSDGEPLVAFH